MSRNTTQRHDATLAEALSAGFEPMPEEAKASVRARVLGSMRAERAGGTVRLAYLRAAAVFAACFVILGATTVASATALPGDSLYPIKRAMEETSVVLSPGRSEDALIEQTRERADEVRRLMEKDAPETAIDAAAGGFTRAAVRAIEQQNDPASAERTMRRIEEGVADQPARVQERIREELPSSGDGSGSQNGSSSSGSSGSGGSGSGGSGSEGSGSGQGSQGSGSGEGNGNQGETGGSGSGAGQGGSSKP